MATYIALVNELLRRLNETTLDTAGDGFGDARNLQAIAKDAINSSTREILQVSQEWPFTLTTYTETLSAGTGTYAWQTDASKIDWDTFYLKKLTSADNEPKLLPVIKYEDYLRHYRPQEENSGEPGRAVPTTVYQTQERKYGVTPLPDAAYQIEYRYWSFPSDLTAFDDTSIIPDRFKHVLIDGAMMYMMRFRSNEQSAALHQQKFESGIDTMRRLLLDEPRYITSTIIPGRAFNRVGLNGG
jgi:hypothetical protein